MTPLVMSLVVLVVLAALFAVVFGIARGIDNYSIVDVAWSFSFALVAVFYATLADGWWVRRALIAALVVAWSLRLGIHLWRRIASHHPEEDGRYEEMREQWRSSIRVKMFLFFQLQAVSVVVLALPFLFAATNTKHSLGILDVVGAVVWLVAWIGESRADAQLARFKRDPLNRGRVCAEGLWRYSRHPNYFFEWLIWVGFFLVGAGATWGWIGVIAPAGILHLLLNVTGVPPTEKQSLRSKGDAYRRYQETTNAFFPWPPRIGAKPAGMVGRNSRQSQ